MNKNYIPLFEYKCFRKDEQHFTSLESILAEQESNLEFHKGKLIKGYSDNYNSVITIVTDNKNEYKKDIAYNPRTKIIDQNEIQIREKGYHKFIDFTFKAT